MDFYRASHDDSLKCPTVEQHCTMSWHAMNPTHNLKLCSATLQATFCLAGGVLPTLNMDKLPVPLPDVLLMG